MFASFYFALEKCLIPGIFCESVQNALSPSWRFKQWIYFVFLPKDKTQRTKKPVEVDIKFNHEVCHLSKRKQSWNEVENSTRSSFMISSWWAQWDQVQLLSEKKDNVWEFFWLHSTNIKNSLKTILTFVCQKLKSLGVAGLVRKAKVSTKNQQRYLPFYTSIQCTLPEYENST